MTHQHFDFQHRVALITGGGTGIGRGVALALARRGVQLALVGRRAEPLRGCDSRSRCAWGARLALARRHHAAGARQAVVAATFGVFGRLDILVNNAGVLAGGALSGQTAADVAGAVRVNLEAPIDLTRLALPYLAAQQGAVVLVGSTMSHVPMPYATLYSATKAGLAAFGAALRYEATPLRVQVLTVCPPGAETALTEPMRRSAPAWGYRLADPMAVGERIVAALEQGKTEVIWGRGEWLMVWLQRLAPGLTTRLLATQRTRFARMLDGS